MYVVVNEKGEFYCEMSDCEFGDLFCKETATIYKSYPDALNIWRDRLCEDLKITIKKLVVEKEIKFK